jgi:putative ABC transport system permease protein
MTPGCRHRASCRIYQALLYAYAPAFRHRFGADMATDFAAILDERGARYAWRLAVCDLMRSVVRSHLDAHRRARQSPFTHKKEGPMSSLAFDLRHAVRMLAKAPAFAVVTILTLGLGIGANTATFSLVNAALLKPLGYHDPDRLALVYEGIPQASLPKLPASPPDLLDFKRYQTSFSGVAAFRSASIELSTGREPQRIDIARVSAELFPVLGVSPAIGRTFTPSEDAPGRDVVVLSYRLWQRLFSGRPDIVGETMRLDRRPFEVIGVMPESFEFPKRGPVFNGTPAQAWIPIAFSDEEKGEAARGMFFNNSVVARLKPGISVEQAQSELGVLARRIRENYPPVLKNSPWQLAMSAAPMRDEIAGQIRTPLLLLFAAVALVLLVVCANVANLILSRAASRQRELGVRLALGAPRARLLQLLLCESVLLSVAGGVLGVGLAAVILRTLPSVIATSLPGLDAVALDYRVLTFTVSVSVLTALAFGLVPLFTSDDRMSSALHEGGPRTTGAGRSQRVQQVLVTATVTMAVVLLVGAGLLLRSFAALMATETGFLANQVLTIAVDLPRDAYPRGGTVLSFAQNMMGRAKALPGVRAASISTDVPLESNETRGMTAEAATFTGSSPPVIVTWTFGDYFRALGVPLKAGRSFASDEDAQIRPVAIVSESLARHYWPGQDAIGKRIKWGVVDSAAPWMTIIGVASDVKDGAIRDEPRLHVYVPFALLVPEIDGLPPGSPFGRELRIAMLSGSDASTLISAGRSAVTAVDPALPVTRMATMRRSLDDALAPQRFSTLVLSAFAVGALLLAAIGLYGVLAFAVSQRTREIGVRIALGARVVDVLALVVRQGMRLVVVGLVLGLVAALALTRVMSALLYRTDRFDPVTFIACPIVLALVALLACYLPARRAARIEPLTALRTE